MEIALYLPARDIAHLSQTSRRCRRHLSSSTAWKYLLSQRFGAESAAGTNNPQETYARLHARSGRVGAGDLLIAWMDGVHWRMQNHMLANEYVAVLSNVCWVHVEALFPKVCRGTYSVVAGITVSQHVANIENITVKAETVICSQEAQLQPHQKCQRQIAGALASTLPFSWVRFEVGQISVAEYFGGQMYTDVLVTLFEHGRNWKSGLVIDHFELVPLVPLHQI